jgi:hypothetical protein
MLGDGDHPSLRPDLSDEILGGACVARGRAVVAEEVAA